MNITKDNIILVGFMASGKTTIGNHLAKLINRTFVDTDYLLVQNLGISIAQYFETHGEKLFREHEQAVIQSTCNRSNQVICTGGGAFINPENQRIMLSSGKVFWLDVNRDTVLKRINHNQIDRPLLAHPNPTQQIDKLLSERKPSYEKAHIRIDANSKTVEELSNQILSHLKI